MRWELMFVVLLALAGLACCQRKLGMYKIDRSKISVSGISSGGGMATQMHVAYSSVFMGVGVLSAWPYYCAMGSLSRWTSDCLLEPENVNLSALIDQTKKYESRGMIDATSNMLNDRVFIFHGLNDTRVVPGEGALVKTYYETFVESSNIMAVFNVTAEHTFPTMNYGNWCVWARPWIGRCNYDGAYETLQHIYGNLKRPNEDTALPGDLYEFDQSEFFYTSTPANFSMDDIGFVYVPSGCKSDSARCRLHVAFHGCRQGRWNLGDEFARTTGYNEVGELNNIIILYPQATATDFNPFGCWDVWGYSVDYYVTKNAEQALAVWRMVQKAAFIKTDSEIEGKYDIDRSKISVSGISSGGGMAAQMHVAYSSVFMGVGIIAGVPYYYALGDLLSALSALTNPELINITALTDETKKYASCGLIDPTRNMLNSRVFIYNGMNDTHVLPGVGVKTQEYYENFVKSDNIMTVLNISGEHTFPTMNYGNSCAFVIPWIGRCDYDGAYEILQHIYGNLKRPDESTPLPGDFYEINQTDFFYTSTPAMSSMDDIGFVYVPSGCKSGTESCKLHVALHGCQQGRWNVGDAFARTTGYNEVGELNNIIILYPQASPSSSNPQGCWDIWGYTSNYYTTKNADQTLALWRMVQKFAFFPEADENGVALQIFIYTSAGIIAATVMWLRYGRARRA